MDQTPDVSALVSNNDDNEDLVSVHTVKSSDESIANKDEKTVNNSENLGEGTQCKNGCNLDNTNTESQAEKARGDEIKTASYEINYHLFRMWGKYGLRKITSIGNGNYVFKSNNESGLQTVIENGVWIVNNKPMVEQKWDIDVDINKVEPDKLPIWVKLMCKHGIGRLGYARVLIEVKAKKGLPESIDIQYYDKVDKMTITKTVKVLYD
nr:hypothetical protein [Tanacetum cinerariifolium]